MHNFFQISHSNSFFISLLFFSFTLYFGFKLFKSKEAKYDSQKFFYFLAVTFFILVHGVISSNFPTPFNFSRFFMSIIYLITMIFSAYLIYVYRDNIENVIFEHAITFFCYFLIFFGYISAIGINISGAGGVPVFYFDEPCKFSAALAPFFIYRLVKGPTVEKLLVAGLALKLAFMFPSTTLLFICLFAPIIFLSIKDVVIIYILYFFIASTSGLNINGVNAIENFHEKIPLINAVSLDIAQVNQSLAVFYSGWIRGFLNFKLTYGMGIGFQQLGFRGALDKFLIYLYPLNLLDGATVGAKIINEFGFFGVLFLLAYLKCLILKISSIRTMLLPSNRYKGKLKNINIFLDLSFISFFVNLFVRGAGYFDISCYLFITSLFF